MLKNHITPTFLKGNGMTFRRVSDLDHLSTFFTPAHFIQLFK